MLSSLILWVALSQVPAGTPAVGESMKAAPSRPSGRREAELQELVERRRKRRARASAAWRRERDEGRQAAERLAPVVAAQYRAEAARFTSRPSRLVGARCPIYTGIPGIRISGRDHRDRSSWGRSRRRRSPLPRP